MSKHREYWDGRYKTSDEGKQSLEDDIMDAGVGKFTYPTSDGGTIKETPNSINIYAPDPNPKYGHSHHGVNSKGQTW